MLTESQRCNLCSGRGWRPEKRRSRRGFYARTCRRCGGTGQLPVTAKNPDPWAKHRIDSDGWAERTAGRD